MRTMPDLIEGPDDDTLLPTNGLVRGDGGPPHHFVVHFPVGASVAVSLGGFQRTAQSATILHQARQWERRSQRTDPPPQVSDFAKLDGQARTLLNAMLLQSSNWEVFCDALALCIRFVSISALVSSTVVISAMAANPCLVQLALCTLRRPLAQPLVVGQSCKVNPK